MIAAVEQSVWTYLRDDPAVVDLRKGEDAYYITLRCGMKMRVALNFNKVLGRVVFVPEDNWSGLENRVHATVLFSTNAAS